MELTPQLKQYIQAWLAEYARDPFEDPDRFFEQEATCPVVGIDLYDGYCYAMQATHSQDGTITAEPVNWYTGESDSVERQPILLAIDQKDPEGAYIGAEAEQYAARTGATLYRDFLRVPDERALAAYHGDVTQPSYLRLTELYFRWLMAETFGNVFLVSLPDEPAWAGKEALLEDFLQQQCRYWEESRARYNMEQGEQPDPMDRYFALVLPRTQAVQNGLHTGVCTWLNAPVAAAMGLAATGYLLFYKEAMLQRTAQMLREAYPHLNQRLRDCLCDKIAAMLLQRLDRRLSAWDESGYAARSLNAALWGRSYQPGDAECSALADELRSIIGSLLPTTGRDPTDDPGAFGSFPPIYLGPRTQYGSGNFYVALTEMTERLFLDRFADQFSASLCSKDMSGPFDYAVIPTEVVRTAVQPLYEAFGSEPFGTNALLGAMGAASLGLAGGAECRTLSTAARAKVRLQYMAHKDKLKRELGLRIYENAAAWEGMAQAVFCAIYECQQRLLDDRLRFLQPKAEPAPPKAFEEGWLE